MASLKPASMVSRCLLWLLAGAPTLALASTKPNVLFILTDDQDHHMESIQHMPFLQKYLVDEGTTFDNHFCTVAICCPSRVNLWTGRMAHNTNVTDIFPPYGGYPKIIREGINSNYLPVWMQEEGYNTYYTGKLWNAHNVDNYNKPYAQGFNGSDFLLDPFTYQYYNSWMSRNGGPPINYKGQYSPDVVAEKAYVFLHEATTHPEPWMLTVAPIAPHSDCILGEENFRIDHPAYAPRHAHLFKDYKIPRTPDFNPEKFSGVSWMKDLPMLNDTVIEYNDEFQRSRLRSLQAVDEMIEKLITMLDERGLLDNTYVFFTTDNGYHISQHRLFPGKECGFETDIHIPLIVRGPGIPRGHVTEQVTSHTDLAPTILGLAGASRDDFDGAAITLEQDTASADEPSHEHVNIEFWGNVIPEGLFGKYGDGFDPHTGSHLQGLNNTYKAVRIVSPDYSLYYSVWCTGEKEYYDMKLDPYQVTNHFTRESSSPTTYQLLGRPFDQVISRLDALMMILKSCKTEDCRSPWKALHPKGDVGSLTDALETRFDEFYHTQPKVAFTSCELGYIKEAEGPQDVYTYSEEDAQTAFYGPSLQQTFKYRGRWSEWT